MRSLLALALASLSSIAAQADEGIEFFEKKIRPVLVEHCYQCHSGDAKELQGELRLDLKSGWQLGGESGSPAIQPGKPDSSPLLQAMRHDDGVSAMPPKKAKLPAAVLADFAHWIKIGAPDPREGKVVRRDRASDWETEYQRRLDWWSLKPVADPQPPRVNNAAWPREDLDRFILAKLEAQGLTPRPEAEPRALARRLSFALTGLPPDRSQAEQFAADPSPQALDRYVAALLASPHFGERWARHWMDVVHYSDTHGYEWDVPAKNAWRYRDYLIRAFNADLPYDRLVVEHLAGDLLEPRIVDGANESLIGPLALRLGERRHGDNAGAEGVGQEAVSNMIDTIGKAFLGTTLACAQCHDHKLDAVEQRDYYSLAGMLMSTRYSARPIDRVDPNRATIHELKGIKQKLRAELSKLWLTATDPVASQLAEKIAALPLEEKPPTAFPASLLDFWKRTKVAPLNGEDFAKERAGRVAANQKNLKLLADFSRADGEHGWRWEGFGLQHGLAADGDFVVAEDGPAALLQVLPAGRFSHLWSQRLAGSLQSPQFEPGKEVTFSLEMVAGKFSSQSFIIDRALHSERLQFMNRPALGWLAVTAGRFDSLEGSIDRGARLVYFELATKSLNNYFPPRVGYNGVSEAETTDPRSYFGVTRIYQHPPGQGPQDELARFATLYEEPLANLSWPQRLAALLRGAVERWSAGTCSGEDVRLLQDAMAAKLLPNDLAASAELRKLVADYRAMEKHLQPDRTVGSVADWQEPRNERVGIRGSYTEFGEPVERAAVRFLGGPVIGPQSPVSGRLEWAQRLVGERSKQTARVYVNRVWHYLFGAGLVRTPDDFGHLGELPTHPELLDFLTHRFVESGWSTKKLIRSMVMSSTWRQSSGSEARAVEVDPENRLWHHLPMRRLEAEAIRDSLLAVSGRLDPSLYGPPIEPHRTAEDSQKRLFKGPLDGNGRRSIYLKMTLMEPPRFLALFNQPIPKLTVGRRDLTNVPDQALALLNDPFVVGLAEAWSKRIMSDGSESVEERSARMIEAALGRPARLDEVARLVQLVRRSAELRGEAGDLMKSRLAWQDAAHVVFNLKEFLYVP